MPGPVIPAVGGALKTFGGGLLRTIPTMLMTGLAVEGVTRAAGARGEGRISKLNVGLREKELELRKQRQMQENELARRMYESMLAMVEQQEEQDARNRANDFKMMLELERARIPLVQAAILGGGLDRMSEILRMQQGPAEVLPAAASIVGMLRGGR